MKDSEITRNIHTFLMGELKQDIIKEYKEKYRIVSESDLQAYLYHRLMGKFGNDDKFLILTEKPIPLRSKKSKRNKKSKKKRKQRTFPDIIIFYDKKPIIIVELKEQWKMSKIPMSKDLKSIKRLLHRGKDIEKAYWILLVGVCKKSDEKSFDQKVEAYINRNDKLKRNRERFEKLIIPVFSNDNDIQQAKEWRKKRKELLTIRLSRK